MINAEQVWLLDDTLNSSGQGRNYGLELSLERKLAKGWYFMLNAAVFRSEYYAEDEIWRHSAYDRKFTLNALGGKEWSCGKAKQNLFSINGRLSWSGGMYFTPPDIDESLTAGMLIDDEARIYAEQAPDMAVLSMSVNYRKNKKNHSSIWTLQVINLLSAAEFMGYKYDELNNEVSVRKDAFFMPSVAYKIEF
jgi:outer membrane receptor protein involved in Fe transport